MATSKKKDNTTTLETKTTKKSLDEKKSKETKTTKKPTGTKATKKASETKKSVKKEKEDKVVAKKAVQKTVTKPKKKVLEETISNEVDNKSSADILKILKKKETKEVKLVDNPSNGLLDEKGLDHVAILKKKREAQMKLNENILEDNPIAQIKSQLSERSSSLEEEINIKDDEPSKLQSEEINKLKEENERLNEQISKLLELKSNNELEISNLNNALDISKKDEVDNLNKVNLQLKQLEKENEELKRDLDVLSTEKEQVIVKIENSINKISKLEKENEILSANNNKKTEQISSLNKELELTKKETKKTLDKLTEKNKELSKDLNSKDKEISKLNNSLVDIEKLNNICESLKKEIAEKEDKISVLTNSIIGKANDVDLLNEIENLKKENELLKTSLADNEKLISSDNTTNKQKGDSSPSYVEIDNKSAFKEDDRGEVILRIKLLNERIAEKDKQIMIVEEELNKLTEKDIVAENFTKSISEIRNERKKCVTQANYDLSSISELVKASEEKVNSKKKAFDDKINELEEFEKNYDNLSMTYTEKESMLKKKSRLYMEKDALQVEIETHNNNYQKLLIRYKNRLKQAEERVDSLNETENDLIALYLGKLRESISRDNVDYLVQKEEREYLISELNYLNKKIDYPNNIFNVNSEDNSFESFNLEISKKQYADVIEKLNLIASKYEERENVEKILLRNESVIAEYYQNFREREILCFNIKEKKITISKLEEELNNELCLDKEGIENRIQNLNVLIDEDNNKVDYYSKEIEKNKLDEKVNYYIRLMNSMLELKDAEKEFKVKAKILNERIEKIESLKS